MSSAVILSPTPASSIHTAAVNLIGDKTSESNENNRTPTLSPCDNTSESNEKNRTSPSSPKSESPLQTDKPCNAENRQNENVSKEAKGIECQSRALSPYKHIMKNDMAESHSYPSLLCTGELTMKNYVKIQNNIKACEQTTTQKTSDKASELPVEEEKEEMGLFSLFGNEPDDLDDTMNNEEDSHYNYPSVSGNSTIKKYANDEDNKCKYKGFINLGNTCYLNSALQMMMSVEGFVNEIIASYQSSSSYSEEEKKSKEEAQNSLDEVLHDNLSPVTKIKGRDNGNKNMNVANNTVKSRKNKKCRSECPLRNALAELFLSVKSNSTATTSSAAGGINPSDLKNVIDNVTPQFIGYRQQDAHEFFSTLLDLLHDEMIMEDQVDKAGVDGDKETATLDTSNNIRELVEKGDNQTTNENQSHSSSAAVYETDSNMGNHRNKAETMKREALKRREDNMPIIEEDSLVLNHINEEKKVNQKKARVGGISSADAASTKFSKVSSFSELNIDDIGTPLHGDNHARSPEKNSDLDTDTEILSMSTLTDRSWSSVVTLGGNESKNMLGEKLLGGRIAPSVLQVPPLRMAARANNDATVIHNQEGNQDISGLVNDKENGDNDMSVDTNIETSSAAHGEGAVEKVTFPLSQKCQQSTSTAERRTPVDKYFTTHTRTHLICDSCKFCRSYCEVYRHFSIDIGPPNDSSSNNGMNHNKSIAHNEWTVKKGLRRFFSSGKRELKCEKCSCESATQTTEILRLPQILVLHLKRFIVDISPCFKRISYKKNNAAIDFPEGLSLNSSGEGNLGKYDDVLGDFLARDVQYPEPLADDCIMHEVDNITHDIMSTKSDNDDEKKQTDERHRKEYKIRSIVNHIGSSANHGHYTADALKLYDNERREWTRFNDSSVSLLANGGKDAMGERARRTAYMIMFFFE